MKPASPDFNRRDRVFSFTRVNSDAIANFKRLLEAGRDSTLLRFSLGSEYLKIRLSNRAKGALAAWETAGEP